MSVASLHRRGALDEGDVDEAFVRSSRAVLVSGTHFSRSNTEAAQRKAIRIAKANGGKVIFFQNEMPYDVPSQAAWMSAPGVNGFAAFKVANSVTSFNGYGMGSYSFFNQGLDIYADNAFDVPANLPAGSLNDLLTIFLDPSTGEGGILNVVNGTGGSSTIANPDVPVTVVSYP